MNSISVLFVIQLFVACTLACGSCGCSAPGIQKGVCKSAELCCFPSRTEYYVSPCGTPASPGPYYYAPSNYGYDYGYNNYGYNYGYNYPYYGGYGGCGSCGGAYPYSYGYGYDYPYAYGGYGGYGCYGGYGGYGGYAGPYDTYSYGGVYPYDASPFYPTPCGPERVIVENDKIIGQPCIPKCSCAKKPVCPC